MTNAQTGNSPASAVEGSFRLLAAALSRTDLDAAVKVVFAGMLCDPAFRRGWIVSNPITTFVAELNIGSAAEFERCVEQLVAIGAIVAKSENGAVGVRLGPWAIDLLQLRAKRG